MLGSEGCEGCDGDGFGGCATGAEGCATGSAGSEGWLAANGRVIGCASSEG